MMALGFLAATSLTTLRMREMDLDPDFATTLLLYCLAGGVFGAKVYYTIDEGLRTGTPWRELFFSRGGLTWYGGLIGAIVVGAIGCKIHGVPILGCMNAVAPGTAVGQALGRDRVLPRRRRLRPGDRRPVGRFVPAGISAATTDLVHPTQIYEMFWLLPSPESSGAAGP